MSSTMRWEMEKRNTEAVKVHPSAALEVLTTILQLYGSAVRIAARRGVALWTKRFPARSDERVVSDYYLCRRHRKASFLLRM